VCFGHSKSKLINHIAWLKILLKIIIFKTPKKCKLYINFFEWARIPAPKTDEDPIPVYGDKIETVKNNESLVNIGFNNDILKKYGKKAANADEQEMLINLAIQYLEDQNAVSIDLDSVKVLNDTICFGDKEVNASKLTREHAKKVSTQYEFNAANEAFKAMESNQMPDEQTVFNNLLKLNINPNAKKPQQKQQENDKPKVKLIEDLNPDYELPKYELEIIDKDVDIDHDTVIQIKIHLSKINSISECDLSIESRKITLIANKAFYKPLEIILNDYEAKFKFDLDQLEAKFIKKSCILKLIINAKKL
jgi:hypothetical protein